MTQRQGDYPIDQSDANEFQRLAAQDNLFNRVLPLLPEGISSVDRVLDVACGTGGWLRCVKDKTKARRLVGLDQNKMLLQRASVLAASTGKLIQYQQGDMFRLADIFKRQQFDLIHMRSSTWFLGNRQEEVFSACQQLLAPEGTFYVVDFEQPFPSTSIAMRRYGSAFFDAMSRRGTMFKGTPEIAYLFRKLGFHNVKLNAAVLNLSSGAERDDYLADIRKSFHIFRPMIIGSGVMSEDEYESLIQQCLEDMDKPDFGMLVFFLLISGQK